MLVTFRRYRPLKPLLLKHFSLNVSKICRKCARVWTLWTSHYPDTSICPYCEQEYLIGLYEQLTPTVKEEIDQHIYNSRILEGIKKLKDDIRVIGLHQSKDLFQWRYEQLRSSNPRGFFCSHNAYWDGFYS